MFHERRCRLFAGAPLLATACMAIVLMPFNAARGQPSRHRDPTNPSAGNAHATADAGPRIEAAPPAPGDDRPAAVMLDALEFEIVGLESGGADAQKLANVEAEAREAERRAQTASEQFRARRFIRRIERAANGRQALESGTTAAASPAGGLATLAQFVSPATEVYQGVVEPAVTVPGAEYAAVPVAPMLAPLAPPPTRHYVNLDALGWWVKSDQLPPLVTTSPVGTPQAIAGVLGQPTTTILFGDQAINGGIRPGGRVQGGIWVDPFQTFAVEGHYYALATTTTTFAKTSTFSTGSLDDLILARPFFDDAPGVDQQSSVVVAFPDFVVMPLVLDIDGSIRVQEYSRIQSAGGGGRYSLGPHNGLARLFLLGAYRFFDLAEGLSIKATSSPGTDPFPFPIPQGEIQVFDRFTTQNTFNGGEVGLGAEMGLAGWSLGAETRLALGNMHQTLEIDGRTSAVSGGYVASYPGGLLAQPTNIGDYTRNRFALIPQLDVKLGFQVLPAVRWTVGYNLTFVTNVLRPGDQVDLTVNTTQIAGLPLVGPARPAATLDETTIWLQGVTTGLDMRF
jgi:hypothetical protein